MRSCQSQCLVWELFLWECQSWQSLESGGWPGIFNPGGAERFLLQPSLGRNSQSQGGISSPVLQVPPIIPSACSHSQSLPVPVPSAPSDLAGLSNQLQLPAVWAIPAADPGGLRSLGMSREQQQPRLVRQFHRIGIVIAVRDLPGDMGGTPESPGRSQRQPELLQRVGIPAWLPHGI